MCMYISRAGSEPESCTFCEMVIEHAEDIW